MHEWHRSVPIRVTVPGPPKALERNRTRIVNTKDGRQFVANYQPAKSRAEHSTIRSIAASIMGNRPPLDCPLELRLVAYMPIPRSWSKRDQAAALADRIRPSGKPDADNLLKMAEDGMTGVVWRDDSLVTDTMLWKRYSDRPRLVIEVYALECRPVTAGLFEEVAE